MGGKGSLVLLVTATLAMAIPVAAQGMPFVAAVPAGSNEVGQRVTHVGITFGYVDANGNGVVDLEDPNEPVYLDVDASNSVTFGDIRLVPFLGYPSGSQVDVSNQDFGLALQTAPGWMARAGSGALYFDLDRSESVTVGDVRFGGSGAKVRPGDPDIGTSLETLQRTVSSSLRVAWHDLNGNSRRDLDEPFYLDLNGDGTVGIGDVRIMGQGLVVDGERVKQSDLDALEARLTGSSAGDGDGGGGSPIAPSGGNGGTPAWLVVLVVVNLIAVGVVGWKAFQKTA